MREYGTPMSLAAKRLFVASQEPAGGCAGLRIVEGKIQASAPGEVAEGSPVVGHGSRVVWVALLKVGKFVRPPVELTVGDERLAEPVIQDGMHEDLPTSTVDEFPDRLPAGARGQAIL